MLNLYIELLQKAHSNYVAGNDTGFCYPKDINEKSKLIGALRYLEEKQYISITANSLGFVKYRINSFWF